MRLIPSYDKIKYRKAKDGNFNVWNTNIDKVNSNRKDNEDNDEEL